MARPKRAVKHASIVTPYPTPSALDDERNIIVRPLTTPNGRNLSERKKKAKKPPPAPPRKVGLGVLESSATSTSNTSVGNSLLAASIAAVLNSRPAAVLEREQKEMQMKARIKAQMAGTEALKKDTQGEHWEDVEDDWYLDTTPVGQVGFEAKTGGSQVGIARVHPEDDYSTDSDSDSSQDSQTNLVVEQLLRPKGPGNSHPTFGLTQPSASLFPPSLTLNPRLPSPPSSFPFNPTDFSPTPLSNRALAQELGLSGWAQQRGPLQGTASTVPTEDMMELDEMFPPPAPFSIRPGYFTPPKEEPQPFTTSMQLSPNSPPPESSTVQTEPFQRQPTTLIRKTGNRKPKKPKLLVKPKKRAELFDYKVSSDEDEEAWDDLKAPLPGKLKKLRRSQLRSGKAIDGLDVDETVLVPETGVLAKAQVERLCPTSYQTALLEQAKTGSIITVLPTGSGKTLVAVLLMEWMHTKVEPEWIAARGRKRMQFFLVNSVPLVHQQANILAVNSSLRVGKLFGALGINLSSKEEWEYNHEHYDCLVLTAQLLLDSLAHGFISMSEISLLTFDEAHHAKSNHPYASILRDFYGRIPVGELRPRILGLTASPLNSNEGLAEAERLQKLFDARLVTAPVECLEELRSMVSQPTELIFKYTPTPRYRLTSLFTKVHKCVTVKDEVFIRCSQAAQAALAEHGPAASDLVWHLALARYAKNVENLDDVQQTTIPLEPIPRDADFDLIHPHQNEIEMDEVVPEEPAVQLPEWLKVIQNHRPSPKVQHLSPKLQTLVRALSAYTCTADSFCGIVFVNRRLDAFLITQLLRQLSKTVEAIAWLKVACVTGHGASASRSLGPRMQWTEQAEVLSEFREGQCNLLIATSVVQEGLDVQPCNFVCRFDLYSTHISMAQSRGRARRAGSHYILFVQEGSDADHKKIEKIRDFDHKMDELLVTVEKAYDGDYGDELENDEVSMFTVEPSTKALLTPHFSVALLYRYCQSLPASDAFNSNKPRFEFAEVAEKQYVCTITLPASSKIRYLSSDPCPNTKSAKRRASYQACRLLRNLEALDPHFLPIRTFAPLEEIHDEEGRVVGSRKRQIGYEKKLSDEWTIQLPFEEISDLFGTLLEYASPDGTLSIRGDLYQPIVLLSRNRLPNTPPLRLFIEGQPFEMFARPITNRFTVSSSQRAILTGYALRVFTSVLNRLFEVDSEEILYFIAPLSKSRHPNSPIDINALDWAGMQFGAAVYETPLDPHCLSGMEDAVIVDLGKNNCRYFFKSFHENLHPHSDLPPGRQSDAGFRNVLDYYLSFNEPLFHKVHVNPDQPLLQVSRMPRVVSYLTATPRNDFTPSPKKLLEKTSRFAMPQLCSKHSIPSSLFRTYLMLPSILTQLDQLCLAQELNNKLFGGKLDLGLVRISLTTPSASLEESYERLELLGDAFLKYLASVYCFVALDKNAHEGDLHHSRLHLIQNSTLFQAGLELNLPAYLVSRPFTSRLFVPPNFKLVRGQPPPHLSAISDKTIADVVEALLGAAYETGYSRAGLLGGFDLALEAAIALKVETPGINSWSDMSKLFGEVPSTAPLSERPILIEQKLNRRFTHAHLLTEALTHPSKLNAAASFQRLEWLGDSLVDFYVIRYCWSRWASTLPPGHLTELKGAMVSNETLSALAVELELDKYMAYDDVGQPGLTQGILVYRQKVTKAKHVELKEAEDEGRECRPYWLLLDAPKAIADIIESLFGAVFVDSGFDPAAPQATFDNLLAPFFELWVSPTKLRIDAIRILLETAQAAACDDVSHVSSTVDGYISDLGEVFPRVTKMSVVAHGRTLATVQTPNSKTAKRLVSANALTYLQQNPAFFGQHCDCETKRAIQREEAEEEAERRRNEGLESEESSSDEENDSARDDGIVAYSSAKGKSRETEHELEEGELMEY